MALPELIRVIQIEIPEAFEGLYEPYRYKAFYGGRGSAKSHSFATALLDQAARKPLRVLAAREVQKSIAESVKQLLDDKIDAMNIDGYRSTDTYIEHENGSHFLFSGLREHTAHSIKSMEGVDIAWVEEASSLSKRSLELLRPTIRKPGSEIWFSWNPDREWDAVDQMFRGRTPPANSLVRKVSFRDNPFFTAELQAELDDAKANDEAAYEHVWEGGYRKATVGAYFAKELRVARHEGRTARKLALDPMLPVRTFWDLGTDDSTAVWVEQWVEHEIRCLRYIEGSGQGLSYYVGALRNFGFSQYEVVLPHDAASRKQNWNDTKTIADLFTDAGFNNLKVVPNQGPGAAMQRVEALRRLFPRMWFDPEGCEDGLKVLDAYHEKRDEARNIGLGPEHDWSSHGSDAAGLGAIVYKEPSQSWGKPIKYENRGIT